MKADLIEHFSLLPDHRIERNKSHALIDIMVLVICAVVSSADGWETIEQFGKEKLAWLRKYVPLVNGTPSHDCIVYVMCRLSPQKFRDCFISCTQAVAEETGGEVIAVDGKTAKGSRGRKNGRNPLYMVSAWAWQNRLVLGQQVTDEKSNEITTIPKLLELLELKGCIVTIDAMGCQRSISEQIIGQDGDYVLGMKGNQGKLHEAVEDFLPQLRCTTLPESRMIMWRKWTKIMTAWRLGAIGLPRICGTLPEPQNWKGLRGIDQVERECLQGDTRTLQQRYFISSIAAQVKPFAQTVRGHWGVENLLHWRPDMIFGDDTSRIRKGHYPAIMTTIRHLCMNLFEQEPTAMSLAKKRRNTSWSVDYRAKVIFS